MGTLYLLLTTLVLVGTATTSIAQGIAGPSDPHPRAHELHALAAKILPTHSGRRPRADVTALRQALESLDTALEAAQSDPSSLRLAAVDQRSQAAQSAFAVLRSRLVAAGGGELATSLDGDLQVLWGDIGRAIAASQGRRDSLATVRAQLRSALSRRADPRGSSLTVIPLLPQE